MFHIKYDKITSTNRKHMIYLGVTIETINCHIKSHHNSFYGGSPLWLTHTWHGSPYRWSRPQEKMIPVDLSEMAEFIAVVQWPGGLSLEFGNAWYGVFEMEKTWSIGISTYDFKIWILKIFPDLIYEELRQYHEIWYWLKLDIVSPVTANLKSDPTSLLFETAHGCMVCVEHPYPPW